MILISLIFLILIILFFFFISKFRASRQAGHKLPSLILTVITGATLLFILGFVFFIIDYYSARHWIEVTPIVDASHQDKGMVGFSLPSGDYLIVVNREEDSAQDDSFSIKYIVDVPEEGLKIEEKKDLQFNLGLGQYRLKSFTLKKNKSKGLISVEILKPSKSKIAVKLVTNRYFDM